MYQGAAIRRDDTGSQQLASSQNSQQSSYSRNSQKIKINNPHAKEVMHVNYIVANAK
jgi:hypothetical protein